MMSNFFRSNLNLKNFWWHRLLSIAYFSLLLLALYMTYHDLFVHSHPYIPQWKVVGSLDKRIAPEVRRIADLVGSGERVAERDRSYILNTSTDAYDDVYCSENLANQVTEVKAKSGINTLYIREIYDLNAVPEEIFANYIRANSVKCLFADAYSYPDQPGRKSEFLEPNKSFQEDFVFYKKSGLATALYAAESFLLIIGAFAVIAIAYYRVVLYIIFGSAMRPAKARGRL